MYNTLPTYKVYNLISSDLCVHLWNHHHNQDNEHTITLRSFLVSLCHQSCPPPSQLPSNNSHTWASLHSQNLLNEGEGGKPDNLCCQSFSQTSPKQLTVSYQTNCMLGKRNYSELSRTTGHWFWTVTKSRRLKTLLRPTSQSRGLWRSGDQMEF